MRTAQLDIAITIKKSNINKYSLTLPLTSGLPQKMVFFQVNDPAPQNDDLIFPAKHPVLALLPNSPIGELPAFSFHIWHLKPTKPWWAFPNY